MHLKTFSLTNLLTNHVSILTHSLGLIFNNNTTCFVLRVVLLGFGCMTVTAGWAAPG